MELGPTIVRMEIGLTVMIVVVVVAMLVMHYAGRSRRGDR